MTSPYAWGLIIQLSAWFIIVNALAYAVHPLFYILENSALSSWAMIVPFAAIDASVYLIKFGGTLNKKNDTAEDNDD